MAESRAHRWHHERCGFVFGCGGISAGLWEACRNIGLNLEMVMACDLFPAAKESYVANFSPTYFLDQPIEDSVNGGIGDELTIEEEDLRSMLGEVDIVVGGPPFAKVIQI